jgi:hypothetical protein
MRKVSCAAKLVGSIENVLFWQRSDERKFIGISNCNNFCTAFSKWFDNLEEHTLILSFDNRYLFNCLAASSSNEVKYLMQNLFFNHRCWFEHLREKLINFLSFHKIVRQSFVSTSNIKTHLFGLRLVGWKNHPSIRTY